ncbi:MAG: hypothetical protein WKF36_08025 [Candidatus Nitrosocosmicus sp.]
MKIALQMQQQQQQQQHHHNNNNSNSNSTTTTKQQYKGRSWKRKWHSGQSCIQSAEHRN